jgi:hypothetical protein
VIPTGICRCDSRQCLDSRRYFAIVIPSGVLIPAGIFTPPPPFSLNHPPCPSAEIQKSISSEKLPAIVEFTAKSIHDSSTLNCQVYAYYSRFRGCRQRRSLRTSQRSCNSSRMGCRSSCQRTCKRCSCRSLWRTRICWISCRWSCHRSFPKISAAQHPPSSMSANPAYTTHFFEAERLSGHTLSQSHAHTDVEI